MPKPLLPSTRIFFHLLQAGATLAQLYNRLRLNQCLGCGSKPLPFGLLCTTCRLYWQRRMR